MKKLILIIAMLVCQPSFANDWFPQVPKTEPKVEKPIETQPNNEFPIPKVPDPKVGEEKPIPKTVDPQTQQSPAVLLRQPCDRADKMFAVLKKYKEYLLFTGEGLTFGLQGNPYKGAMMFFTNQDTGTWTILNVYKDGMACMITNGTKFQPYGGDQPNYGEKQ